MKIDDWMFDYQSSILAIKVDVIIATIDKVSLIIFMNYDESSTRKETCNKNESHV